jgi:hypothetical protein
MGVTGSPAVLTKRTAALGVMALKPGKYWLGGGMMSAARPTMLRRYVSKKI